MNHNTTEKERLDEIASIYSSFEGFEAQLLKYRTKTLLSLARGENVLELGCADGYMTRFLVKEFKEVTAVDSSRHYLEQIKKMNLGGNLHLVESLFENYDPKEQYDLVIASHVLEHVVDPVELLKKICGWLNPKGCVLIAVPNANSLHRRIGRSLGILTNVTDLSETDKKVGHRRVYTKELLIDHIQHSGLTVDVITGIFLKPLSNAQMESWDSKIVQLLFDAGQKLPELCAQLCVRCRKE